MRQAILAGVLALAAAAPALTQVPAPTDPQEPSPERGRSIVENGTQAGAAPCASCHGMDGLANGSDQFPRLDGQSAHYLFKQLDDYASGARQNEIMAPIAQSLSDAEKQDASAYFGALGFHATQQPQQKSDPQLVQAGERIVNVGIAERGVQNCVNCHGPAAAGLAPATPRLAGQWASYTRAQFTAFRDGTRRNDVAAVMRNLSHRLSDDEIAAAAAYLETARSGR